MAGALGKNTVTVDLTDSGLDFNAVSMTEDDVAVTSVPAYAGRIPAVVADRLGMVRGNGARAVLVCVYCCLLYTSPIGIEQMIAPGNLACLATGLGGLNLERNLLQLIPSVVVK